VDSLLDVGQVALLLGVKPRTVRDKVQRHVIPFIRVGSLIRFRPAEIDQYVKRLEGCSLKEALDSDAA
jgi:excisionase family DNA binding protein